MNHELSQGEVECLRDVLRSATELGVPVLLVGAKARELVFNLPNRIPLPRATYDWDSGVRVAWQHAGAFLLGYDAATACAPETIRRLAPVIADLLDPYSGHLNSLIGRSYVRDDEEARRQTISNGFRWLRDGIELAVRLRADNRMG